ncbi:hypothetical protein [Iningainema tapete]|uniref:Uncharacterized protein n=1 Tax=Iningainema tapete BLCC-T55 TaxID=2748662 RepID=A0A8J7C8H3_9CYAN|nr:hypothetical protein [Iningainema tapete]MBD2774661.1 hypothetical protein [Iningainema tapete BLCC-T55]
MAIFRQYIAPLIVVLIFLIALVAVSARIFLPSDMASPAPIEQDAGTATRRMEDVQSMSFSQVHKTVDIN